MPQLPRPALPSPTDPAATMVSPRAAATIAVLVLALCAHGGRAASLTAASPRLAATRLADVCPQCVTSWDGPVQLTAVDPRPDPLASLTTRVDGRAVRHLLATQEVLSESRITRLRGSVLQSDRAGNPLTLATVPVPRWASQLPPL